MRFTRRGFLSAAPAVLSSPRAGGRPNLLLLIAGDHAG
jgi:hypothetical protein